MNMTDRRKKRCLNALNAHGYTRGEVFICNAKKTDFLVNIIGAHNDIEEIYAICEMYLNEGVDDCFILKSRH